MPWRKRAPQIIWVCLHDGTCRSDRERKRPPSIREEEPYQECAKCPGPVKYVRAKEESHA